MIDPTDRDPRATVRADRLLHGYEAPAVPIPAATVLLLRDGDQGLEVLMTRRSARASFAPGAFVFPGGRLDAQDHDLARAHAAARLPAPDAAFAIAAIREAFEELGVLIARDRDGSHPGPQVLERMNRADDAGFASQLLAQGLVPALDEIHWFSHWITDPDLPKRFDTRFFVARMPHGQQPVADDGEQFEPVWVTPRAGLERHERGEFAMIFPTIRTLRQLLAYPDTSALIDACRDQTRRRWRSSPRAGLRRGQVERFSEDESPYGELELVSPDGRVFHALDWQHEPVQLLRHVWRITAPNPGRMTGPGTNCYVIGEPGAWIVVDPGPDDASHIERIANLVGDGLQAIVCTHSHPDHYPGAKPLRARLQMPQVPILGRPSGPKFNPAWPFTPDRVLADGERLRVGDSTLRVVHTPGHASNHVCLLLDEDGLLLSGDHILNGSTTVIDPPDGDMRDYLDSLERLATLPVSFILPAHGHVLGRPLHEIRALIAHRLKRERKVANALVHTGGGTLEELVLHAYDDVDPILHPVARRSLTAHLVKLAVEGRAREDVGGRWAPTATI